jgi:hypothetical protein
MARVAARRTLWRPIICKASRRLTTRLGRSDLV